MPATLEQLLDSGGRGGGGQKVRLIVLERRNVTAEHASWVRAFTTGNWGRTPAEQAAVASGQHGVAPPLAPSAATLARARTPLRMFRRQHMRWFARVRELARQAGAPMLSLSAEELMQGGSALAAAVARARTFVTTPVAPQGGALGVSHNGRVAGGGRLWAAKRQRGRGPGRGRGRGPRGGAGGVRLRARARKHSVVHRTSTS